MGIPDYESVKIYASGLIEELPENLDYHNRDHFDDVLRNIERLAEGEGISGKDLLLLLTGGLFHDIGYIEQYERNEHVGARFARKELPRFGYSSEQIERICNIITATQLKERNGYLVQDPDREDPLQLIICDADLDPLGRDDFFETSSKLRRELENYGERFTEKEWLEKQIRFLENHQYFTETARETRDKGKEENLKKLKEIYNSLLSEEL